MIAISKAINSLYPTAQFVIENEDYSRIRWIANRPEEFATLEELEAEVARLEQIEAANAYQQQRKYEYPPLADLADALYHQANGNNAKMEAYLAACEAVKLKYPKGSE